MPSDLTQPDLSAILALPYLMPAQAQKHVTHNEALRLLDVMVQLAVLDRDRTAPPAAPAEGDRHLVAAGAGGAWAGQEGRVAAFLDGGWSFFAPRPGWRAEVLAEGRPVVWDGSAWTEPAGPSQLPSLGVNTGADSLNRLAVAAPATLLTHEGGGHQLKINKAAAEDTASLLFQSGWTGYAEMGLAGDTGFSIKGFDGSDWFTALAVDNTARSVRLAEQLVVGRGPAAGATLILQKAADAVTSAANIQCTRMRGSFEAPAALLSGTVFTQLAVNGHDGAGFSSNSGAFAFKAAQDWSPGNQGTRFTLELTANDSKTRREVLTIEADGRALLEGRAICHQGNLLGPVALADGIPAGAAIERGANADGDYVKFADGTLICTRAMAGSASGATTWTFPAAFAVAPAVSGAVQATALSVLCLDAAPQAGSASFSLRGTSGRRADTVHLTAVGRWA